MKFFTETKLGYLITMLIMGIVIVGLLTLILKYYNINYSFIYGMLGYISTIIFIVFLDRNFQKMKWF